MIPLIQQLNSKSQQINEEGAGGCVGAGSIAACATPLLASMVKRSVPNSIQIIKFSNSGLPTYPQHKQKKKGMGIKEAFYAISEEASLPTNSDSFDANQAISKLKSLEDKESVDYRDTSTFGLVDNNGDIVRVTIPTEQAEGFEKDIQHFLGNRDESEPAPEIAEVLFNMKDRYTIINVDWPQLEEDAEEGQELEGQEEANPQSDLPAEGDQMPGDEGADAASIAPTGDATQVTDLLTQVIDMMKADAEARKSEAQAREAEANTRQANAARDHAMARVKQEEQFLDMDEYSKNQKSREKEAKRLAQLSKWKHDMAKGEDQNRPAQEPQYDFLPGEENEETYKTPQKLTPQTANKAVMQGKISSSDIAKYIASRVR
jgi:hypothetical protein